MKESYLTEQTNGSHYVNSNQQLTQPKNKNDSITLSTNYLPDARYNSSQILQKRVVTPKMLELNTTETLVSPGRSPQNNNIHLNEHRALTPHKSKKADQRHFEINKMNLKNQSAQNLINTSSNAAVGTTNPYPFS
jgi:hypothetical protein